MLCDVGGRDGDAGDALLDDLVGGWVRAHNKALMALCLEKIWSEDSGCKILSF